jgi:flagellin
VSLSADVLTSQASAKTALTDVTTAISDISAQRGAIGANINQLNAAANVASSEEVNLSAADSAIRATNFGQATSDLAKFQVLSQTGISALAQANSAQQEILKLLQ